MEGLSIDKLTKCKQWAEIMWRWMQNLQYSYNYSIHIHTYKWTNEAELVLLFINQVPQVSIQSVWKQEHGAYITNEIYLYYTILYVCWYVKGIWPRVMSMQYVNYPQNYKSEYEFRVVFDLFFEFNLSWMALNVFYAMKYKPCFQPCVMCKVYHTYSMCSIV